MKDVEFEVTLAPVTLAPWFTQVYAGLFDLENEGLIRLKLSARSPSSKLVDGTSLPISARCVRTGVAFRLLIDLNDNRNFAHPDILSDYDVIAKRSYLDSYLARLSARQRSRIIPYGVNLCCGSRSIPVAKIVAAHHASRFMSGGSLKERFTNIKAQHQLRFLLYLFKSDLSLLESDFTEGRNRPLSDSIFFLTRLFGSLDQLTPFSMARIDLVRDLKRQFGARFIGGIMDSELARQHCDPELIFSKLSRRDFIAATKSARVVVCTLGVGDSTPWKLGEYLAGGRCIVSEPLKFALPDELKDAEDVWYFNTNEECVQRCDQLLSNPQMAADTGRAAASYYDEHVQARNLIRSLLRAAHDLSAKQVH